MTIPSSSFTIVSWNVLADSYVKPEYFPHTAPALLEPTTRRLRLVRRLTEIADDGADVLCLQEVEPEVFAMAEGALASFAGRWVSKVGKPDGCAIFVRRTLGPVTFRELAFRDGTGHVAVAATIDEGTRTTSIATTHLKWQAHDIPSETRLGRGELLELLDAWVTTGERWIVCGDLNAPTDSPVLEVAYARGFVDAYASMPEANTANANGRRKRIDFILHTKDWAATPAAIPVIDDLTPLPSETEPSDHLAIKAVLVALATS